MDGSNVNIKLLRHFKDKPRISDPLNPVVLDIGTCGLHTFHNAFITAIKTTKWELVEFLKAIYNVFKDVPAQQAEYNNTTESNKFSLKFCVMCWLNNFTVAEIAE